MPISSLLVNKPNRQTLVISSSEGVPHRLLLTSIVPLSFFDLKVEINRKRKNKIEAIYIHMAIKACEEIAADWRSLLSGKI